MYNGRNVDLSSKEVQLLEIVNRVGPCTSEQVHEAFDPEAEFLLVMRSLHALVQKGFLQRVVINKKQLYRTSRNYSFVKAFLNRQNFF